MTRRTTGEATVRLALALGLLGAVGARSAPMTDDEVRQRFELATRLYSQGNTLEALDELEGLAKLGERPAVLMNLVIVNAELGRPEASLAAADRLLSSPGALEASRLARVKAIREEQRQKLGEVLVTTPVDGVELSLSGRVVGQTPLPKPVLSRAGPVMLIATAKGYEPLVRELTVPAGGTLAVTLELVPTTVTPGSGVIRTSTPDTNVLVDGQLVGVTPDVTKVPLMPGARTLSVAREHYASAELVVNVSEGGVVDVPLEPTATPGEETAQVAVTSTEGSVTFTVDGLQGGLLEEKATARLVPGRHRLAFERGGFFPIRREVWLASSRVQTFDLVFEPTAELRAELTASRALRRIAGFTAIGLGAAGAIASGIYAFGVASVDEAYWKKQVTDFERQLQTGKGCAQVTDPTVPTCQQNITLAKQKLVELGQARTIGFVSFATSLVAIAGGLVSVLLAPDLTRFERPISNPDFIQTLSVSVLPEGGAAVGATGRF
jgi:hypothetical protein